MFFLFGHLLANPVAVADGQECSRWSEVPIIAGVVKRGTPPLLYRISRPIPPQITIPETTINDSGIVACFPRSTNNGYWYEIDKISEFSKEVPASQGLWAIYWFELGRAEAREPSVPHSFQVWFHYSFNKFRSDQINYVVYGDQFSNYGVDKEDKRQEESRVSPFLSAGTVAGIAVAGIVFVALIIVIAVVRCRRKKRVRHVTIEE
jgi:hypothetical protein